MKMVSSSESTALVVLILIISVQLSCGQNASEQVCASSQGAVAEKSRMAALQSTFQGSYSRPLDLIFVIDRSTSIGITEFNETKDLMNKLISFLSERKYIFISPENTRVAVISFGLQAISEFDGISVDEGGYINACILGERISALQARNAATNGSEIAQGLSRAGELFSSSRNKHGRTKAKQILWVFFDGAEGNQSVYEGRTTKDWARELRDNDVKIFAVGVGAWIRVSIERENRVTELASSRDQYSCVETWLRMLQETPQTETGGNENLNDPVYNEIAEVYSGECGVCPGGLVCACDVTNKRYSCTGNENVIRINGDDSDKPWLLPAAIGAGAFGFILLLILLIVVPVLAKRRKEERKRDDLFLESQPVYEGPLRPPPKLPRRRNISPQQETSSTNIYGNCVNYGNIGNVSRNGAVDSHSSDEPSSFDVFTHADDQQTEIQYDDCYVNTEAQLENDMPGWSQYLYDLRNSNRLLHLAIRSIPGKRWVVTPGFGLQEKQVRDMEKVMRHGNAYRGKNKIKIAQQMFKLDVDEVSELHFHAIHNNGGGTQECAWISKVYDYVIVGIANGSEDEACQQAVYELYRYLYQLIQESGTVTVTADNERNNELILRRLSARVANHRS